MSHRARILTPAVLAVAGVVAGVVLAACQDYNFSPVRYCLIQPGTERVTLSDISTADILFVVDDSGSMGLKQKKVARSFKAFIDSLKANNVARVAARLEPIDFHIAITTTSVFSNLQTTATCSTSCGGAAGQQVCCDSVSSRPLQVARGCTTAADCTAGNSCLETCSLRSGEKTCCAGPGAPAEQAPMACTGVGSACGRIRNRYEVSAAPRLCGTTGGVTTSCSIGPDGTASNPAPAGYACRTTCTGAGGTSACCDAAGTLWSDPTCDIGVGSAGALYPRGDFVRKGSNARVLHFDKSLFCARATDPTSGGEVCACTLPGGPATCDPPAGADATIQGLITQFEQNVAVGTCGSGQEQGLEAARRAIQKALGLNGLSQPLETSGPDAGSAPAWPHPRHVVVPPERATSKLVVVFVGDEDDCSAPEDPTRGIIQGNSGTDACKVDQSLPIDARRAFKVEEYAAFLASLGRPVAGAFVVSADTATCVDGDCTPAECTDPAGDTDCAPDPFSGALTCGGVQAGVRFISKVDADPGLSKLLAGRGSDTVTGSVCNPSVGTFGAPGYVPGFSSVLQRVAEVVKQPAGLRLPTQPAAAQLTLLRIAGLDGKTRKTCVGPAPAGTSGAALDAYDWWFTGGDDTDRTPTGPSRFVFLNRITRNCEANPGETYSADYLGLVPAGGCLTAADCQAAIGGVVEDWTCDLSQGGARGTCLCGS